MTKEIRYVFPFLSIFKPRDRTRPARLVGQRDATAAMLGVDALQSQEGRRLGGVLFNFPPPHGSENELAAVDANAGPADLLLTCGRIPIQEEEQGYRAIMDLGYTVLERVIIEAWMKYLHVSAQGHTMLDREVSKLLERDDVNRGDIEFYQDETARYQRLGRRSVQNSRCTAAFMLRARELWEGGPEYLGFFGMSASTTLVLAHLLRQDLGHLLREPAFTMLEMHGPRIPRRPMDMGWGDDWKARVLIRHAL